MVLVAPFEVDSEPVPEWRHEYHSNRQSGSSPEGMKPRCRSRHAAVEVAVVVVAWMCDMVLVVVAWMCDHDEHEMDDDVSGMAGVSYSFKDVVLNNIKAQAKPKTVFLKRRFKSIP